VVTGVSGRLEERLLAPAMSADLESMGSGAEEAPTAAMGRAGDRMMLVLGPCNCATRGR
jgi:hypothetical protein